jgi:hypothetical protein
VVPPAFTLNKRRLFSPCESDPPEKVTGLERSSLFRLAPAAGSLHLCSDEKSRVGLIDYDYTHSISTVKKNRLALCEPVFWWISEWHSKRWFAGSSPEPGRPRITGCEAWPRRCTTKARIFLPQPGVPPGVHKCFVERYWHLTITYIYRRILCKTEYSI